MLNATSWGTLILGFSGLVTGLLAFHSARSSKSKIESETSINVANAEQSREILHQSRETFLRTEMDQMRELFEREIGLLREEVSILRALIENHVPWDWEVVRQLKLAGIDFRDPPTLNYLIDKHLRKDNG